MAAVYVGDLHSGVTEAILAERFGPAGPIRSIRVCRDRTTRSSLGYAYVNFQHRADAERAVDMFNFEFLMGKPMRVMRYERDSSVRKTGIGNLFIKHLDKSIDNLDLFDTFSVFGKVLSCKVVGYETGPKGYGYVQFESVEAAELAKKTLNGKLLNNRQVVIENFNVREERKAEKNGKEQDSKQVYVGQEQTKAETKNAQSLDLFIKNIDNGIDGECLRSVFSRFGTVTNAMVMMENGRSLGFGFVGFSSSQEAMKARKVMNSRTWARKPVNMSVSRPTEKSQAYPVPQDMQRMGSMHLNTIGNISQPVLPPCEMVNTIMPSSSFLQEPRRSEDFTTMTTTSVDPTPVAEKYAAVSTDPAVGSVPDVTTAPAVDSIPDVTTAPAVDSVTAVTTDPAVDSVPDVTTDPSVDSVPDVTTAPAVDSVPDVTAAPSVDSIPDVTTDPAVDSVPAVSTEPVVDSVPSVAAAQQDKDTMDVPTPPPVRKLTIYMLESAPVDEQVQMAYDYMLPLVENLHPIQAKKITWMLLEGETNFEIMNMIGRPELLRAKVDELDALLKAREAGLNPKTLSMLFNNNSNKKKRRKKNKRKSE